MNSSRREAVRQYAIGIPISGVLHWILAICFVGEMQGIADSVDTSVPWYYRIPGFFVSFPFLYPSEYLSQYLRPLLGSDNAAIFTLLALQGAFWGFIIVFLVRYILRFLAQGQNADSAS
jgi:hypothetical protein